MYQIVVQKAVFCLLAEEAEVLYKQVREYVKHNITLNEGDTIFDVGANIGLFEKINTEAQLKEELLQLASIKDDYLSKFELLWTSQKSGEYFTDEELLLEYINIISLA